MKPTCILHPLVQNGDKKFNIVWRLKSEMKASDHYHNKNIGFEAGHYILKIPPHSPLTWLSEQCALYPYYVRVLSASINFKFFFTFVSQIHADYGFLSLQMSNLSHRHHLLSLVFFFFLIAWTYNAWLILFSSQLN